ncbi:hypothetical protein EV421DRAFT_1736073 [Armillaria borealis]|uniref:Uncharacterized protein n=1 Tax=Armillaria borealis TaxID=47425 RepID=A0AA39JI19_9AGAR|nr:hypothetical protein EV421DRAFT_1736073 [Armillaria borealis]
MISDLQWPTWKLAGTTVHSSTVLSIDETQAQAFDDEFCTAGTELPTVTTLMVSTYYDFMVPLCPNGEHVVTYGWVWLHSNRGVAFREHSFGLIGAAGGAKMLQHFEMNKWWTIDLLKGSYSYSEPVQETENTLTSGYVFPGCQFQSSEMHTWALAGTKFSEWCKSKWRCAIADMVFGTSLNLDVMGYRNSHS